MNPQFHNSIPNFKTVIKNTGEGKDRVQLKFCSETDHIKYCIRSVLLTRKGERSYFPNLGGTIMSFLFQQFQSNVIHSVRSEITRIISEDEKRVRVNAVEVERDERDPQLIFVAIKYQIHATGEMDSFSFEIKP